MLLCDRTPGRRAGHPDFDAMGRQVGLEPFGGLAGGVGERDGLEVADAVFFRQVRGALEILRIERVVAGHVAARLRRRLAGPDEAVEIGRRDDVPAHRVEAARAQDPAQRLDEDAEARYHGPGPPEHALDEGDDRLAAIAQLRVADGLTVQIAQPQIRREMAMAQIVPEALRAGERRHHAEIDRHRHERVARDRQDLALHLHRALVAIVEQEAVAQGDALRLGERDVVDDIVLAAEGLLLVVAAQYLVIERLETGEQCYALQFRERPDQLAVVQDVLRDEGAPAADARMPAEQFSNLKHVAAVVREIVVQQRDHRIPAAEAEWRARSDSVVDAGGEDREIVADMAADFGRHDAEVALEAAGTRRLHEMEQRIDAALTEQAVGDRKCGKAVGPRPVDGLEGSLQVVRHDFPDTVDAARADDVEEARGEFGKSGADAAARDHRRAAAAKVKGELSHAVEVGLQPGQEHQVVARAACRIERPVPVLVVQAHVEVPRVDERADMQAVDRLHEVARAPLVTARAKVRTDNQRPPSYTW